MIVEQTKSSKFGKFARDAQLANSRGAVNKDKVHSSLVKSILDAVVARNSTSINSIYIGEVCIPLEIALYYFETCLQQRAGKAVVSETH